MNTNPIFDIINCVSDIRTRCNNLSLVRSVSTYARTINRYSYFISQHLGAINIFSSTRLPTYFVLLLQKERAWKILLCFIAKLHSFVDLRLTWTLLALLKKVVIYTFLSEGIFLSLDIIPPTQFYGLKIEKVV